MKILLADDHPLVREGLRQVVKQFAAEVEVPEAHDWDAALTQVAQGISNKEIARDLKLSGATVKAHIGFIVYN